MSERSLFTRGFSSDRAKEYEKETNKTNTRKKDALYEKQKKFKEENKKKSPRYWILDEDDK